MELRLARFDPGGAMCVVGPRSPPARVRAWRPPGPRSHKNVLPIRGKLKCVCDVGRGFRGALANHPAPRERPRALARRGRRLNKRHGLCDRPPESWGRGAGRARRAACSPRRRGVAPAPSSNKCESATSKAVGAVIDAGTHGLGQRNSKPCALGLRWKARGRHLRQRSQNASARFTGVAFGGGQRYEARAHMDAAAGVRASVTKLLRGHAQYAHACVGHDRPR